MLQTYSAVLRGGRIEWGADGPPPIPADAAVPVHVTLLDVPPRRVPDGKAMAAALDKLAASGAADCFGDPVEWQRETRRDRPLPGREE